MKHMTEDEVRQLSKHIVKRQILANSNVKLFL